MIQRHLYKKIIYFIDNRVNKEWGQFFGKLIYHYPVEYYQEPKKKRLS